MASERMVGKIRRLVTFSREYLCAGAAIRDRKNWYAYNATSPPQSLSC